MYLTIRPEIQWEAVSSQVEILILYKSVYTYAYILPQHHRALFLLKTKCYFQQPKVVLSVGFDLGCCFIILIGLEFKTILLQAGFIEVSCSVFLPPKYWDYKPVPTHSTSRNLTSESISLMTILFCLLQLCMYFKLFFSCVLHHSFQAIHNVQSHHFVFEAEIKKQSKILKLTKHFFLAKDQNSALFSSLTHP